MTPRLKKDREWNIPIPLSDDISILFGAESIYRSVTQSNSIILIQVWVPQEKNKPFNRLIFQISPIGMCTVQVQGKFFGYTRIFS